MVKKIHFLQNDPMVERLSSTWTYKIFPINNLYNLGVTIC